MADERELHERLVARDAGALAALYDQSSSAVHAMALRITGDRESAEDITQAVFMDLWLRPERYAPDRGALRPWLATVAHHTGVDLVRREVNVRNRELHYTRTVLGSVASVEEIVESALVSEQIRIALDDLPAQQSLPIRLAFFGGLSYQQVAVDLGIPEGTVKSRIRIGLRRVGSAIRALEEGRSPETIKARA